MDYKKMIKSKKSEGSLTTLVVSMLIVIAMFSGGYLYMQGQMESSGVQVDAQYNESYTAVQDAQADLNSSSTDLRDSITGITEASEPYSVAVNGFKGIGNALQTLGSLINLSWDLFMALIISIENIIPPIFINIIGIGIIIVVLLILLAIFKGDSNKI